MARDAVASAFEARLGNPWNGLPVEGFDEVTAEPPDSDHGFIAVQFPVTNGEKPALSRHFLEEGTARLVLNVKKQAGLRQARQWADELADLFNNRKFSGVQTFTPDGPIETDNNDDGNYIALAVVIPYRYQFQA